MWDKHPYIFFFEEIVILITTHKHESNIQSFLNKLIIYYLIRVPIQKGLTFVVVAWGYKG